VPCLSAGESPSSPESPSLSLPALLSAGPGRVSYRGNQPEASPWLRPINVPRGWLGHCARRLEREFPGNYVWQMHPGFAAAYDGAHSLKSQRETGYTLTATLFLGFRPWRGAELFFNPEMLQSTPCPISTVLAA